MKTLTFPPPHHYIDITPLQARYDILMAAILAFIEAGQIVRAGKLSHKMYRVVRLGIKLETQNILLKRKLDMLFDKCWRDRVLKQLGGMRRLKSWEAAAKRNAAPRKETGHDFDADPVWLDTPERRAESERLKEHVKKCARACISPNVVRDRIRMDFEGQFRLAPIPRQKGSVRKEKIYTEASICDYYYNAVPYHEVKTFGPATVWPAEFHAAIEAEERVIAEREKSTSASNSVIPHEAQADDAGPNTEDTPLSLGPASQCCLRSKNTERGMTGESERKTTSIPTLCVKDVISSKSHIDMFRDPFPMPVPTDEPPTPQPPP
jgi:hypothetical protein